MEARGKVSMPGVRWGVRCEQGGKVKREQAGIEVAIGDQFVEGAESVKQWDQASRFTRLPPVTFVPVSLCPCFSMSLYLCVPVSLCPCISMSLYLYVHVSLCLCISMSLCLCISIFLWLHRQSACGAGVPNAKSHA